MSDTVVNSHVSRLGRFLSFRSADQVYEERADPEQLASIATIAGQKLASLVKDDRTKVVVLTGDERRGEDY